MMNSVAGKDSLFFADDIYHNQPQGLFVPNKHVKEGVWTKTAALASTETTDLMEALPLTFIPFHSIMSHELNWVPH